MSGLLISLVIQIRKDTLLSHFSYTSGQAFACVSVDEQDNDPKVLLGYVARALYAVQPVDSRVFEALASPVSSVPGSVVPRCGWRSVYDRARGAVLYDVHLCVTQSAMMRCPC